MNHSVEHAQGLLSDAATWQGKIYNGTWCAGGLGKHPVLDKATAEPCWSVGFANAEDVEQSAGIAQRAQRSWAQLPAPLRGDILRRLSELVLEHREEIAWLIVRETGSIQGKADWEVQMTAREILEGAALCSQPSGILTATAEPGRQSIARRIPLGVVGIITPWNSPLLLGARAIAPALAMGNAVLLKPDQQTPICGGVVFARLLELAGLPQGLFHVLPGPGETGAAVVGNPRVEMISFTGSTRTGREIGRVAGGMLKRVALELGGNNPFIVLDDADIDLAARAGAWGSFFHQGQICMSTGRHLVHARALDAYVDALIARSQGLRVGNPAEDDVQLGPMINETQAANVERLIAESLAMGATLRSGGTRSGLYFQPTVVTGVKPGMPLFEEEIFGPVAAITEFQGDDEAIELANLGEYGLSAAVVSPNLARAQRVADRLQAGIVHINDQTLLHEVFGPIGGVGASGNGANYSTLTNADQFSEWQWLTVRAELPMYPF
ncbi:benzaldehyde dehydrogenase [Pseudomonas sp. PDNC002]|uniref:benzaldehyde dehydrogenase n=1 Tax=Pseudomonas sp. PDNC002 TaxID=2811422 RepID=UPI001964B3D0|nr:benzaldehyde dehydrogenase [Pseudomonas sp. PDNC002]QRY78142.1 benzaldehyde dehydrogenase [Pseudomonas sp. PDNC002]